MNEERRLESWKEIGAYLQRDLRTARRWEKEEGLPVHRHSHKSRSSVYAYASEIDAWRLSRKLTPEPAPPLPLKQRLWRPSFAVALVACLLMAGSGLRPVSARQSEGKMTARQVLVEKGNETVLDISPDGRYAALTEWPGGDLAIRDLKTGANRRLTDTRGQAEVDEAAFSPDSKQIAYNWQQLKGTEFQSVMLMPVAGGASKTLWRGPADEYMAPATWTRDGKQLVVKHDFADGGRDLAMLSVHDGTVRKIKSFAQGVHFFTATVSPDGKWIAYGAPNQEHRGNSIFVLAADGSRESKAAAGGGNFPLWSPDGSRIVFVSGRTGQRTLWSLPIVDGKPGKEELLRDDIGTRPWMTRNGTMFYEIPGVGGPNIYSAEIGPDGKISQTPVLAVQSFVNGNNNPSLSPDGVSLFYRSTARRGSILRSLPTGEDRVIAPSSDPGNCCGPSQWFPDGRSLLVASVFPRGSGWHFYRADLTTGKSEPLFDVPWGFNTFSLSRDGKSVFYSEGSRLIRYDLATKRETDLKKTTSEDDSFGGASLSPDGRQLAYVFSKGSSTSVEVMPAEGGASREVLPAPSSAAKSSDAGSVSAIAWTSDQQYLLVARRAGDADPTTLWRVPVSGGLAAPTGISMRGLNSVQVHPDGRRIFFTANDSGPSEIWALENFLPKAAGTK